MKQSRCIFLSSALFSASPLPYLRQKPYRPARPFCHPSPSSSSSWWSPCLPPPLSSRPHPVMVPCIRKLLLCLLLLSVPVSSSPLFLPPGKIELDLHLGVERVRGREEQGIKDECPVTVSLHAKTDRPHLDSCPPYHP